MKTNQFFEYYHGHEADQFTFYRIPKQFFKDKSFAALSDAARILYGLLLDRTGLSRMNDWRDELGRVYIYFKVEEIMKCLHCAKQKAVKLLKELEKAGLIERRKQGLGRPDRIYVKSFIRTEDTEAAV